MPPVTFYRQKRADGGVRTGIDVYDEPCWQRYEAEGDEHDPTLLWFVELRADGRAVPDDCETVRDWLLTHSKAIKDGLREIARKIEVGLDHDDWPAQFNLPHPPEGVRIKLVVSAIRRVDGREMAKVLLGISRGWKRLLGQLKPVASALI